MPAIQLKTLAALTGVALPAEVGPEFEMRLGGERSAAPLAGASGTALKEEGEMSDDKPATRQRVDVDFDRCEGHGFCEQFAPEIFELDDAGELTLKVADIDPQLLDKATAAARACPVAAIKLKQTEVDG
jgi:ferredoxin